MVGSSSLFETGCLLGVDATSKVDTYSHGTCVRRVTDLRLSGERAAGQRTTRTPGESATGEFARAGDELMQEHRLIEREAAAMTP
jgi:hypothetical protein